MITDTTERGLERLICTALTGAPCDRHPGGTPEGTLASRPAAYGAGWVCGEPRDYDREHCIDLAQLATFLEETQPEVAEALDLRHDGPMRRKFLARLQGEVTRRGTLDVLRKGIQHKAHAFDLFYGTPSPGNERALLLYELNRFSVTRQLRYSRDQTRHALDLVLFVNGLPVATFELKNSLTKQTVADAVEQYQRDRDPREKLFELGRCVVHFAVDEHEVRFCTHLRGRESWFLPFDQGWNDGRGNPPNPNGLKTDYLWTRILTRDGLTDVLENYAQLVETRDEKTGRKRTVQIWPRYHQLDVVRRLLADARQHGAGRRYLIQHSAGSGKSNSIAWLAHQLVRLERANAVASASAGVFDSVVVVTDRRLLDQQIQQTIKRFAQVGATVGHAEHSGDLRRFLEEGKKIVITTVQKFPYILDAIGSDHRGRRFAILVDEAHSSQGGRTAAKMSEALSEAGVGPEAEAEDLEDRINRLVESHRLLPNASYFAFTATPKNKTLEIFGAPDPQPGGTVPHRPFHVYTMKQAIEEGFILDVLRHYTPVASYYRLIKRVEDDPEYDSKRARKKLNRYVEGHQYAIGLKAEILVDHFHEQVVALRKIGGQARAMVVTSGIERAIQYFHAIEAYLAHRNSSYRAIVAFSGEHDFGGDPVTEATLNNFPSNKIAERIREDPYRFLVCADKFQTGYDEPLLHTMYVDKVLTGIKAVQTLSRLNRAHPQKHDVFVLDFMNDAETIEKAFAAYHRTTILAEETDPDKLHDLKADLDAHQVYTAEQVDELVRLYLGGAGRERLDPILDTCVAVYREQLDEDGQVEMKGKAKAFLRTYGFLSAILPYTRAEWEKLSIFLEFLVPKLPAPVEEDLSRGILEAIDMDSYRVEKQATVRIQLPDADAAIGPVPTAGAGPRPEPELDRLSSIIAQFNELHGTEWTDRDRVERLLREDIPRRVSADPAYRNAREHSDRQNARIEHDRALQDVMIGLVNDDMELVKKFMDDGSFRRSIAELIFGLTYDADAA